jgi:hypothetical protein
LQSAIPAGGKTLALITKTRNLQSLPIFYGKPIDSSWRQLTKAAHGTNVCRVILLLSVVAALTSLPLIAKSQSAPDAEHFPDAPSVAPSGKLNLTYVRPTEKTKFNNYLFDMFGPYPVLGAAATAGINQANNVPPEWNQGAEGYFKRFGSHYGISMVATTTRYGLSKAFNEDDLYYQCECSGIFPRTRHALVSTLTARRGEDGHRVFSVPALVAPYVGAMVATYGWYPNRYGAKDAFRMGNYSLLTYAGENLAMEFIFNGSHSLFRRMHLKHAQGSSTE